MDAVRSESGQTAEIGWEIVSADAADVASADSPKVVDWEDLQQDIALLWSFSTALKDAKVKKEGLSQKLDPIVKVRTGDLHYRNELESMKQKLEAKKTFIKDLSNQNKKILENLESQREQLSFRIRTLLTAGKTLCSAHNQLQEANKLLNGENGLEKIKRKLRKRQQYMVNQVASLYPVRVLNENIPNIPLKKIDSSKSRGDNNSNNNKIIISPSRNIERGGDSNNNNNKITILGLQLMPLPVKKTGFTIDKKEFQNSATALGYVAHAVHLIALYLDVPLRYPLLIKGSNSYIRDYSPSIESITGTDSGTGTGMVPIEFPLFFEGQDVTRATYSIFLLNKDLEQLLNYIGAESLGPRHILANLKELMRIILSDEFLDS